MNSSYELIVLLSSISIVMLCLLIFVLLLIELQKDSKSEQFNLPASKPQSWMLLADSIVGKAHLKSQPPTPCQDSHRIEMLNEAWGIAIVSDGLGSKPLSHIGSDFVSQETARLIREEMVRKQWHTRSDLPSEEEWKMLSYSILFNVRENLKIFAKDNDYRLNDLACTVIAVIFSPIGVLVTHIGDGRAGYRTAGGEWKSMMTPINGETSSHVMPITGDFWDSRNEVERYIESNVIHEHIDVFTLLSDGCESFSYETINKKGVHVNKPFKDFYEPVVAYFTNEVVSGKHDEEWKSFLTEGTKIIDQEPDDKTMIIGILQKGDSHENANSKT